MCVCVFDEMLDWLTKSHIWEPLFNSHTCKLYTKFLHTALTHNTSTPMPNLLVIESRESHLALQNQCDIQLVTVTCMCKLQESFGVLLYKLVLLSLGCEPA